jgi:four helix bundle protein
VPISRFEELVVWQKARALTKAIYQITRRSPFARDFGLSGQIQWASVSVMSNIAEGFERGSPGEFYQFLSVARASCAEVRSQLYVALDVGYLQENEFDASLAQADEVARMIGGLRTTVGRRRGK